MFAFLLEYQRIILSLHVIGVLIGIGGMTYASILFFAALRDARITLSEERHIRRLGSVVWFGVLLLTISGVLLYIPYIDVLNAAPLFLVKTAIFLVIIVNTFVLTRSLLPQLHTLSQKKQNDALQVFPLGAVLTTSWYSILVLSILPKDYPLSFVGLAGIFLLLLVVAVFGGQAYASLYIHMRSQ